MEPVELCERRNMQPARQESNRRTNVQKCQLQTRLAHIQKMLRQRDGVDGF